MPVGSGQAPTPSRKYLLCDGPNTCAGATRPARRSFVLVASSLRVSDTAPAVFAPWTSISHLPHLAAGGWVKTRTILVGYFQREFGTTIRCHPKAKA
jgi:hypothetical protein